jgi:hypothetical protein
MRLDHTLHLIDDAFHGLLRSPLFDQPLFRSASDDDLAHERLNFPSSPANHFDGCTTVFLGRGKMRGALTVATCGAWLPGDALIEFPGGFRLARSVARPKAPS